MNDSRDASTSPTVERRRRHDCDGSPRAVLASMPALALLDRLPTPMLAVTREGAIVFANTAFAELIGHSLETVHTLTFTDLFEFPSEFDADVADALVRADRDIPVRLLHMDGGVIRAVMSRSVLKRRDDPVLVTFQDVSELLWLEGRQFGE